MRTVDDVLEQIAPVLAERGRHTAGLGGALRVEGVETTAERILEALAGGPASVDELVETSRLPASEILASVLDLELRGAIRQVGGRQFQLTGRFAGVSGLQ